MRKIIGFTVVILMLFLMMGCRMNDNLSTYDKELSRLEKVIEEILLLENENEQLGSIDELSHEVVLLSQMNQRSTVLDLMTVIQENRLQNIAKIEEIRTLLETSRSLIQTIRSEETEVSESDRELLKSYVEALLVHRANLASERRANEGLLRVTRRNFRLRNVEALVDNLESIVEIQNNRFAIFNEVTDLIVLFNEVLEQY
jgi:uncharacterized protein YcfL